MVALLAPYRLKLKLSGVEARVKAQTASAPSTISSVDRVVSCMSKEVRVFMRTRRDVACAQAHKRRGVDITPLARIAAVNAR